MATKKIYDSLLEFISVEDIINRYAAILEHIRNYFNSKSDVLATRNIGVRITYGNNDINDFMNIFGITENDVKYWLSCSAIPSKFINVNKTRHIVPFLIMLVFFKNQKRIDEVYPQLKKDPDSIEPWRMINMYYTTIILSTLQGKYFQYPPRQDIWDATLENLSGKYILKKVSNLLEFISYYSDLALERHNDELVKGDDENVVNYINSTVTYMNSSLKNIRNEFEKNYKKGNRVEDESTYTQYEDGKQVLNVQSSISNDIEIVVREIMTSFTQDPVVDRKNLEIACKNSNCSMTKIEPIINYMRYKDTDKYLYSLISNILKYYLATKKKSVSDIKSNDFINQMIGAYQISNTKDPFILEIKSTLNNILIAYGEEFSAVGGRQTMQNSRMCLYVYIVLYIVKNK